ncbi:hypothetical protein ACUNV4_07615 [Granulosicoccus sp. 3-233]|uniref:hypothetical protein n=1 Tax=Granulosicoccus sp. 3-233 TaxID=3417969 RepID=UPI003D354F2D
MTTDSPLTVAGFLESQVLRTDYLLIDEQSPDRTRFPHELKLEMLHALCIRNGYRQAADCERIRRSLYTQEQDASCPAALLLAQAYLPDNVVCRHEPVDRQEEMRAIATLRLAQATGGQARYHRLSSLQWSAHRCWLNLPDDIHSLLIERDCALLAA